jgi:pimeloyl-ACP methyl ester carboxylesterase
MHAQQCSRDLYGLTLWNGGVSIRFHGETVAWPPRSPQAVSNSGRTGRVKVKYLMLLAALIGAVLISSPVAAGRKFSDFSSLEGLERTSLTSPTGDRLDVIRYVGDVRRPALVIVPGSLCAPLFAALDSAPADQAFASVPMFSDQERVALDAHIVYLERRNIVSLETMSSAPEFSIEQIFEHSPCSERNGAVTLEQRVADVLVQVRWLKQQNWVESVHLVGVSEGSDVVAGVAASDDSLASSLMLIGGAGPSQFADFAAFARGRKDIASVRQVFTDLDQFLTSKAPAQYKGSSAERWQSFAIDNTPLDMLSKSTMPLFIAHGDSDTSVPVSSADLVAVELMRTQPRRPVFYWSVVGGGHMLETEEKRRLGEIVVSYLAWARSSPSGRTFRAD